MAAIQHRDPGSGIDRRVHQRFRLGGAVRLLVDTSQGLVTVRGELIDMSVGGCSVRLYNHQVTPEMTARMRLEINGEAVWLPLVTCWVRGQAPGWIVGCRFDRLTQEKQRAVYALLDQLRVHLV